MALDTVTLTLLSVSFVLFFGFFAEFAFRRFNVPDVLFLLILGFLIGPNVFNYVQPSQIAGIAPFFTTFTLLFLLFDGAFNISLSSLVREFSQSFLLTTFNFFVSSVIITAIMMLFGQPLSSSLFTGFALGGVSSAFVIPILQQMNLSSKIYSLLALESALTDVFCIVLSLTVLEFVRLGSFGLQSTFAQISTLFAVGALVGIIGGIIWIILVHKVFKEHNFMITIAYLLFVYVLAEFLQGNGAIAALFFGIMLKNSKPISSIAKGILSTTDKDRKKAISGELGFSITTPSEEFFYNQISFFLKTFFFVYIGLLVDLSDPLALAIGVIISIAMMFSRYSSVIFTHKMSPEHKSLVTTTFARGLAAAAIAQIAIVQGVPQAEFIGKIIYTVIIGTIILNSIKVFILRHQVQKEREDKTVIEAKEKALRKRKRQKSTVRRPRQVTRKRTVRKPRKVPS